MPCVASSEQGSAVKQPVSYTVCCYAQTVFVQHLDVAGEHLLTPALKLPLKQGLCAQPASATFIASSLYAYRPQLALA